MLHKWLELSICKRTKIVHVCVGHESVHAVLISEQGLPYFIGTAKRGEDADDGKL